MMVLMVLENLTNALKTANKKRVKVRQVADEVYAVKCGNPLHPRPHYVRFEERADGVYATCDCPSRVSCYHLIGAWNQRTHVLEVQRAKHASMDASLLTTHARRPSERHGAISV